MTRGVEYELMRPADIVRERTRIPLFTSKPQNAVEAFLLSRRIANCSRHTIAVHERNLGRFAQAAGTDLAACTSLAVQRYLSGLSQRLKPVSTHQHFRTLKTFVTWCVEVG